MTRAIPLEEYKTYKIGSYKLIKAPITGWVYFAICQDRVKIGYTSVGAKHRIDELNKVSHIEIELLAVIKGSYALERFLHAKFADLRLHGEWFKGEAKLMRFIARITNTQTRALDRVWWYRNHQEEFAELMRL